MPRNRGKPTLHDISRAEPTLDERRKVADTAYNYEGSPIVTAILGAATIEMELEILLRQRFPPIEEGLWQTMIGENGPFNTFDQKIIAAFAFRIFDEATKDNLKIVKNIRNVFAHAKKLIDFDHELISAEFRKVKIPGFRKRFHSKVKKGNYYVPKEAYVLLCVIISTFLIKKRLASLSAKARRAAQKRQGNPVSPLAIALVSSAIDHPSMPCPNSRYHLCRFEAVRTSYRSFHLGADFWPLSASLKARRTSNRAGRINGRAGRQWKESGQVRRILCSRPPRGRIGRSRRTAKCTT